MSYPESDPKMTKIKESDKSFPGMFRKMKISVYDNWRTEYGFG